MCNTTLFIGPPLVTYDGYSNNRVTSPLFVFADMARIVSTFTSYLICLTADNRLNSYKIENTVNKPSAARVFGIHHIECSSDSLGLRCSRVETRFRSRL